MVIRLFSEDHKREKGGGGVQEWKGEGLMEAAYHAYEVLHSLDIPGKHEAATSSVSSK